MGKAMQGGLQLKTFVTGRFGRNILLATGLCCFCTPALAVSGSISPILKSLPAGAFSGGALTVGGNGNIFMAVPVQTGDVIGTGEVLQITPSGQILTTTSLADVPAGELSPARNGDVFAMTSRSIVEISPSGTAMPVVSSMNTTLDAFDGAVVEGGDGSLYGVTDGGGDDDSGGVFKIDATGNMTTLHSFTADDSARPVGATLILGNDGVLYGTTPAETHTSPMINGTVFKLTTDGTFSTLHTFSGPDGFYPTSLVFASDGNLYGTTAFGGASGNVSNSTGTIFKISTTGTFASLYSFSSRDNGGQGINTEGANPANLLQGADGNFYGIGGSGGPGNNGTIFQVTPEGQLSRIASFQDCSAGACGGAASLAQAGPGVFYGSSVFGPNQNGSLWKLTVSSGGGGGGGGGSTSPWLILLLGLGAAARLRRGAS